MLTFPFPKNSMLNSVKKILNQTLMSLESSRGFLSLSILLCLYTFVGLYFMSNFERANDDWEHLAAMKSFAEAPLHPTHPYSFDTEYSHLFTPYHFFWGIVSKILNISPFFLSPFIGLINVLIFILSVQIFASKFLKDSNLASILLLTLMFLWFLAPGFSGYYQFSHLMKTAIYPYRLAFSLSLLTLALYPIVTSHKRNLLLLSLIPLIFLIHPLSGLFLIITLTVKMWYSKELSKNGRIILITTSVLTLILATFWPFYPVFSTILDIASFSKVSFAGQFREFYQGQFLYCIVPAIPGLYFLVKYFRVDQRIRTIGIAMFIFLFIYLFNFIVTESAALGRVIVYIAFTLQILVVIGIGCHEETKRQTIKNLFYLSLCILALPQLYMSYKSLSFMRDIKNSKSLGYYSNFNHVKRLEPLTVKIQQNSILIAPVDESWILPSLTGAKVLAIKHSDPFVDHQKFQERNLVNEQFYTQDCDPTILKTQNITFDYVLIPKGKAFLKLQEAYPELQIIYADSSYTLLKKVSKL
jgi:hypothetical protein